MTSLGLLPALTNVVTVAAFSIVKFTWDGLKPLPKIMDTFAHEHFLRENQ